VQTTLSDLATQVQVLAASEESVRSFDLDRHAERLAFVDAVRWLVDLGALSLTDGDEGSFVEGRGDALYDLAPRRLAQLLAAPLPPSLAASPAEMGMEIYPETDEGANRRTRHRLMRRLAEEPVLYLDELDERELAYLGSQRHYLLRQLGEMVGLDTEVRREGLAAIDPEDRLSDLTVPSSGTVSHAALLLGEHLAARARGDGEAPVEPALVPWSELRAFMAGAIERYGRRWSKRYQQEGGTEASGATLLLSEAVERLEAMGLATSRPEGALPRPAIARLRPEEVPGEEDEARDLDLESDDV
jgi:uncharacterized protein (TIGR02678 family)